MSNFCSEFDAEFRPSHAGTVAFYVASHGIQLLMAPSKKDVMPSSTLIFSPQRVSLSIDRPESWRLRMPLHVCVFPQKLLKFGSQRVLFQFGLLAHPVYEQPHSVMNVLVWQGGKLEVRLSTELSVSPLLLLLEM